MHNFDCPYEKLEYSSESVKPPKIILVEMCIALEMNRQQQKEFTGKPEANIELIQIIKDKIISKINKQTSNQIIG